MIEFLMRVVGGVSFVACCAVIIAYFRSPSIYKKGSNVFVLYIAICDLMFSVGGIIGIPKDKTVPCYAQSFLTNYFPLCSMFWSIVIVLSLYSVCNSRQENYKFVTEKSLIYIHCTCWLAPLVITLLPLTTENFGPNEEGDHDWCFLQHRTGPTWLHLFWQYATFYFWQILFGILYLYLLSIISINIKKQNHMVAKLVVSEMRRLVWYPTIIMFTNSWSAYLIIHQFISPNNESLTSHDSIFVLIEYTIPLTQGLLTSIAFFVTFFFETKSNPQQDTVQVVSESGHYNIFDNIRMSSTSVSVIYSDRDVDRDRVESTGLGTFLIHNNMQGGQSRNESTHQQVVTSPLNNVGFCHRVSEVSDGEFVNLSR